MRRRKSGLFRKNFIITIFIVLTVLMLTGFTLMVFISGMWMTEKLDLLEENTESITQNTSDVLSSKMWGPDSRTAVMMICNTLNQTSTTLDSDFFVINEEGSVVYCKHLMQRDKAGVSDGTCEEHEAYEIPASVVETLKNGEKYKQTGNLDGNFDSLHFIVACPITVNGEFRGAVFGVMPVSDSLVNFIAGIAKLFILASLFAFVFAFIIIYATTYKMTKPLRMMSDAAKQFADGDFSPRIKVKKSRSNQTEIDELANAFNYMAGSLEAMEASNKDFVSNVSHELKTPMTSISGFIDGMLDGTIPQEERDKYLAVVSDEVKRLSRLVTGMLNMSKFEAGKMQMNPVSFDLNEMIFNTLLSFEQTIEKKNIDVQGLDTMENGSVVADKDMINQVVYNLVDNAVKFTPEGGCITVSSTDDGEKKIIKIRNTGKGIPADEREKIFDRFYKVDKSRSYDVRGAGMGLYIVKTIIQFHGGEITVHSEENEYTEFIFTLPK